MSEPIFDEISRLFRKSIFDFKRPSNRDFFPKTPGNNYCFTFVFFLGARDCQPKKSIVSYDLLIKFDGLFKYTIELHGKRVVGLTTDFLIVFVQFYANENIFIFHDILTSARAAVVFGDTLANVHFYCSHIYIARMSVSRESPKYHVLPKTWCAIEPPPWGSSMFDIRMSVNCTFCDEHNYIDMNYFIEMKCRKVLTLRIFKKSFEM